MGSRGLRGGMSIVRLLAKHRGLRNRSSPPPLSVEQILAWADTHRQRTGSWPTSGTGAVEDAPGETWNAIDIALSKGTRGLPSGSGLSTLLEKHRHVPKRRCYSLLTVEMILAWADEHHRQTGAWPNPRSGLVKGACGETWQAIEIALRSGGRGLARGSSLAKLRAATCGRPARERPSCRRSPWKRSWPGPTPTTALRPMAQRAVRAGVPCGRRDLGRHQQSLAPRNPWPTGWDLFSGVIGQAPWRSTPSPLRSSDDRASPCLGGSVPRADRKVAHRPIGRSRQGIRPVLGRHR